MDPITREAALDLMLDMLPGNPFKVRKHWTYDQLHEMNRKKHYASTENGFDDLLDLPYFIGEDFIHLFEPAIIGCEPGNPWIGKVLERYHDRPFVKADGSYDLLALPLVFRQQLVPDYSFRRITSKDAFREEAGVMNIFSSEFFNGRDYIGAIRFPNGYCSHCFLGSWLKTESATKGKLRRLLPRALVNLLYRYRYQYSDLHMKQIPYQDPKDLTLRC
jgi:hypothetical protein